MKMIEQREPRITRIQRIRNREKEGKTGERELFAASPLSPEYRGEGTGTPAEFFSGGFLIFLGFWVLFFAEQFAAVASLWSDPFLCCGKCGDGIGQMYRSLQTAY